MPSKRFKTVPLTLAQANDLVAKLHRHHKPSVGHRFSIGCLDLDGGEIVGAAIIGRPVARNTDQEAVAEITRLVTDGSDHVCSYLYGAAARIAKEMGFEAIQTFILETEPGTSLKAAGYTFDHKTEGGTWNRPSRGGRREDQPLDIKQLWVKKFTAPVKVPAEGVSTTMADKIKYHDQMLAPDEALQRLLTKRDSIHQAKAALEAQEKELSAEIAPLVQDLYGIRRVPIKTEGFRIPANGRFLNVRMTTRFSPRRVNPEKLLMQGVSPAIIEAATEGGKESDPFLEIRAEGEKEGE